MKITSKKFARMMLSLDSTLSENATETENRIRKVVHFRFFLFSPSRTATEYRVKNAEFFLFQPAFPCATANRIHLGADRPKHKQHGVYRWRLHMESTDDA